MSQEQPQIERTRMILDRYPGVLTDWSGRFIDKQILNYISIGNIVRVSFKGTLDGQIRNTAYFRILKQCKKNKNWYLGVCEDPYYSGDPWFPFKNGQKRAFSIHHITEIPLEWNGNKNLSKNAKFYDRARSITGTM